MFEVGRGGVKLTAFRPEGRFPRLHQMCERAAAAAGDQWAGALIQLEDAKGELTAVWRDAEAQAQFAHLVDEAWAAQGELEPPLHDTYPSTSTYVRL
jgi:hypothetical protein